MQTVQPWLPRAITAAGLALIAGGQLLAAPSPPVAKGSAAAGHGPRIMFAEQTFDFGTIKMGDVVRHNFEFANTGDQALEVQRVAPTCGCTTTSFRDQRVEPGGTGVIPVEFDSRGLNGAVARSILVFSNDPTQPELAITIKSTVWAPIKLEPQTVVFTANPDNSSRETKVVRLLNQLPGPIAVSIADWTNHSFKVELKTVRPGQEFVVAITPLGPLSASGRPSPLIFKTSAPELPLVTAYIHTIERPQVVVAPRQFYVPAGPLRESERRAVMIYNHGSDALVLSNLTVNLPSVDCKLNELRRGRVFSIVLTFPPGFELPANKPAEVRVNSNHPRYPVIRIPVGAPALTQATQTSVQELGDRSPEVSVQHSSPAATAVAASKRVSLHAIPETGAEY